MKLSQIYQPIGKELKQVEYILESSLYNSKNKSILKISKYLLESPGKRIRPVLVILCAKATLGHKLSTINHQLTKVASAIELIHMASLIHDDIIDQASLRHNKPTLNYKWGNEVSIALGDYLYSLAFELIAGCGNPDILECISSATRAMCEGELVQVSERDNLNLLRSHYIIMVKKKTAHLFAASCQAGAMLVNYNKIIQTALKEYGLNFGIAFQIVDDCLDLIGNEKDLGKSVGRDFKLGELTLPVLNLLSQSKDRTQIASLLRQRDKHKAFREIKERFINSVAFLKTKTDTLAYIEKAKKSLKILNDSSFKQGLFALADYLGERLGR